MKKFIFSVFLCVLMFSLFSCSKVYHGTEELVEKAREVIPIADAENTDLEYAGMCGSGDKAIAWFISGNEYQAHYYLPMEIEIKGNAANYSYVRTYKPMTDRAIDVAVLHWNFGYAFLINNPQIDKVRLSFEDGSTAEEEIKGGTIPYTFFVPSVPSEYQFLDADGNEVQ